MFVNSLKIFILVSLFLFISLLQAQDEVDGVEIDNGKLIIASGLNRIVVQACDENILKWNLLMDGYEDADTLVIRPPQWPAVPVAFDTSSDPLILSAGRFRVEISKSPLRLQLFSQDGTLLCRQAADANLSANELWLESITGDYYGIGNRQTGGLINRNGGLITAGSQGGAGAPFVWTTRGWGLLIDSDGGRMELRSGGFSFTRPANPKKRDLECYFLIGTPREIFSALHRISGPAPLFPKFTLGFLNTEWGMDEAELRGDISTYRQKGIPLDAYVLDFDWMDWGADNYGEFRWGPKFPAGSTGQLARDLADQGVKIMGIRKPRIHLNTQQGNYAQANGFFHSYTTDYFSRKQVGRLNFHLPAARQWYWNSFIQRGNSYANGLIGYWNDEADEYGGNLMFLQMQRAQYEGQRGYLDRRVWSINRNFYLGAQRYAYGLWSGDIETGFTAMDRQRLFMLSSIVLGACWWGMDIGGFQATPDAENYFRWIQFGAFVPIFRVHGTNGEEREPWQYGPEAESIAVKYIRLRYELLPYIYTAAWHHHRFGLPMARPLAMDYPDDHQAADDYAEWLFGESLLVHPVTTPQAGNASVYLPAGEWIDYWHGGRYLGGRSVAIQVTRADIPLFVKAGAILPMAPAGLHSGDGAAAGELILTCFPGADGAAELYEDDGITYGYENGAYATSQFSQTQEPGKTILEISPRQGFFQPPAREYVPRFKYFPLKPDSLLLDGKALLPGSEQSGRWLYDEKQRLVSTRFSDDGAAHRLELYFSSDLTAPEIDSVSCLSDTTLWIGFNEPVLPGAEKISNYSISDGVVIYRVVLNPDQRSVWLSTSRHLQDQEYTLTVTGITDPGGNIMPSTTRTYFYQAPPTVDYFIQDGCSDAHMAENFPDNNMGGNPLFEVGRYVGTMETDDKSALVHFDLDEFSLADSLISARLVLTLAETRNGGAEKTIGCYRLLQPWGEGDTNAGIDGAAASAGEVTWRSAFHQLVLWQQSGGASESLPLAETRVGSATGMDYAWEVTGLFNFWLSQPDSNFGVLLKEPQSSIKNGTKVFYARESVFADKRPRLALTLKRRTTAVARRPGALPTELLLSPNYPNPFNAATTLSFFLPRNSPVSLEGFSINGQLVELIHQSALTAGWHQFNWQPKNLPSGVYFIALRAGDTRQAQKCLLIR